MTVADFLLFFRVGGTISLTDWREMGPEERGAALSARVKADADALRGLFSEPEEEAPTQPTGESEEAPGAEGYFRDGLVGQVAHE